MLSYYIYIINERCHLFKDLKFITIKKIIIIIKKKKNF